MAIQGTVTAAREAVIVLQALPTRRKFPVLVDTGFSGELCLPLHTIKEMAFKRYWREPFVLADGRIVRADVYKGQVQWVNRTRSVEVIALEAPQGLLGTQLLQGCRLTVQFRRRRVVIAQER